MCWLMPVRVISCLARMARSSASEASEGSTPNLVALPAVTTFWWCPAPMPGLKRTITLPPRFTLPRVSSCDSESTLTRSPCDTALASSASDTLLHTYRIWSGVNPAALLTWISPGDMASTTSPSSRTIRSRERLVLALAE
ncbi:hypothetical protein DSECCO2_596350 [anaerobic digester metagenome]